jgi:hypothetical protein
MKLTEAKLKQMIFEALKESYNPTMNMPSDANMRSMEASLRKTPQSSPLFPFVDKLITILNGGERLQSAKQVLSFIESIDSSTPANKVFSEIIGPLDFYLNYIGFDSRGQKLPEEKQLWLKIYNFLKKNSEDNAEQILQQYGPDNAGKLSESDLLNELEHHFRAELDKNAETFEIMEKAERVLPYPYIEEFQSDIRDYVRGLPVVKKLITKHQ